MSLGTLTDFNQEIVAKLDPVTNATAFNSFTDLVIGQTVNRYFEKYFRYAKEGLHFSEFQLLTDSALQAIDVVEKTSYVFEIKYIRKGADDTGDLTLVSVDINCSFVDVENGQEYNSSIFKIFDSTDVRNIKWALSVLNKIYFKGQLASFIERNVNSNYEEDEDFVKLWKTICQYFSYYVTLAREYSEFYKNRELLLEFLRQRNLFVCDDTEFHELLYLMNNYNDQIRKRGTIRIINNVVDLDSSGSHSSSESLMNQEEPDGELLRLICYNDCDQFILNFRKKEKLGINIGNSSPMYRGTSDMEGCNSFWKKIESSSDLLLCPRINPSNLSVVTDVDHSVIKVLAQPSQGIYGGIGLDRSDLSQYTVDYIKQYALNVDENIDYEISFKVKCNDLPNEAFISAGVHAFDCEGNFVNVLDPQDPTFATNSNLFVETEAFNQSEKNYFFRGILYSSKRFSLHDPLLQYREKTVVVDSGNYYISTKFVIRNVLISDTNYWRALTTQEFADLFIINWGRSSFNLLMKKGTKKIIPFITAGVSDGNFVYIWDVKIQPISTRYSSGFIHSTNWIDFWFKNRNQNYSIFDLKEIFRKYLLPFDVEFEFDNIDKNVVGAGQINGPIIVDENLLGDYNIDYQEDFYN